MRPSTIDEIVGQDHLLTPGSPLRRLAEGAAGPAGPVSVILWGPPGTGKTTIAHVLSRSGERQFVELNAVSAGVKDVRRVLDEARDARGMYRRDTVLFLDEIHRFSKSQQDSLLTGVENRWIVLVAATTENPSFSIISPLLSRSLLLNLRPLEDADIRGLLVRAAADDHGLAGEVELDDEALDHLVPSAGGAARRALPAVEAAAGAALGRAAETATETDTEAEPPVRVTLADAEAALDRASVRYDRAGDKHYDVASALIKSMRGSD